MLFARQGRNGGIEDVSAFEGPRKQFKSVPQHPPACYIVEQRGRLWYLFLRVRGRRLTVAAFDTEQDADDTARQLTQLQSL